MELTLKEIITNKRDDEKYISIDCESDGLWGKSFMIAVTTYNEIGEEVNAYLFTYNNYKHDIVNEWVKENVLPAINMPEPGVYGNTKYMVFHSRLNMLKSFAATWKANWKNLQTMWHMGHVVEIGLFRELVSLGLIGEFEAPYTPIEIATVLDVKGFDGSSVDNYANMMGIKVEGSTHDPLYDCRVAAKVYFDVINK